MDDEALTREALRINERFNLEIIEAIDVCPYARPARGAGTSERFVVTSGEPLERLVAIAAELAPRSSIEVAQVIFPRLTKSLDATAVQELGRQFAARSGRTPVFVHAAFHPELAYSDKTPSQMVPFFRRAPDAMIQLIRHEVLERIHASKPRGTQFLSGSAGEIAKLLEKRPESVTDRITRENHERAMAGARARIEAVFADILRDRDAAYAPHLLRMARVIDLPQRGTLLVGTDLQGNLGDYLRLEAIFLEHRAERPDTFLVLTGDLVHGPELAPDEWPEQLGSFYHGASAAVLERAQRLEAEHEGHVFFLMGNHEHAHVGGPVVGKFFLDEARRLEDIMGPERSAAVRAWIASWPLVAVAPAARLALLHAAPHAPIQSRGDIEAVELSSLDGLQPLDVCSRSVLGSILWARTTSEDRARAFLRALSPELRVAVYGHDVVREGFATDDSHRLRISTSFGCHDGDKLYLEWELAEPAQSSQDLARRGLRRLWPDAPPVHLRDDFT